MNKSPRDFKELWREPEGKEDEEDDIDRKQFKKESQNEVLFMTDEPDVDFDLLNIAEAESHDFRKDH